MTNTTLTRELPAAKITRQKTNRRRRIKSIDLLRGIVMIVMTLDHVRNYFHSSALLFDPTDLSQTSVTVFFTRWITHYCAPIFIFLSGISAYLYGSRRTPGQLSFFLLSRGLWLVFAEVFIITLGWTFNPSYPFINLQVIWAIGISMIFLSALVKLKRSYILAISLLMIFGHNLLDGIRFEENSGMAFFWSVLHTPDMFKVGHFTIYVHYPVIPWIGVMGLGYCIGRMYEKNYDEDSRKRILLMTGILSVNLFILLRSLNIYGDATQWSVQRNDFFSFLSCLNVTKYPPSLLYLLMTLGPAMIFLAISEKPLNKWTARISVLGRVPMFFYILHIYLIHWLAIIGATISGYKWSDMILSNRLNRTAELTGYGFDLPTVYLVWMGVLFILYPLCHWFDRYKKTNSHKKWLSYL